MKDLPCLLLVGLLAGLLGISEHGVRAMLRRGEIPGCKLGRKWVVRRDALEAYLRREERRQARRTPDDDAASRFLRGLPRRR